MTRRTTMAMKVVIGARYQAGESVAELAELFGRSVATVTHYLVQLGIPRRSNRKVSGAMRAEMADRYRAGATIRELCAAYGVGFGTVHWHLTAAGVEFRARGRVR